MCVKILKSWHQGKPTLRAPTRVPGFQDFMLGSRVGWWACSLGVDENTEILVTPRHRGKRRCGHQPETNGGLPVFQILCWVWGQVEGLQYLGVNEILNPGTQPRAKKGHLYSQKGMQVGLFLPTPPMLLAGPAMCRCGRRRII